MHKAFARQLRRTLGIEDDAQLAAFLAAAGELAARPETAPGLARGLTGLGEAFARIAATYDQYDRDLDLRTRSLELSSEELLTANAKLQTELKRRELAIHSLRDTARTLQREVGLEGNLDADD
ncbi:MAG: hypothetical protein HZC24_08470, partial [Rhodocyclales bacterium]|nr:hypothetical protein [Rhodocyclales bacterium]